MAIAAVVGVLLLAASCQAMPQGIGANSQLSFGRFGSFNSGFGFNGPKSNQQTNDITTTTTESSGGWGINSNLGLGKAGGINSGFGFQPGQKAQASDRSDESAGSSTESNKAGINSNLGLGPLGSINSGFNVNIPTTTASNKGLKEQVEDTTTIETITEATTSATSGNNNVGINSNLGLGPVGNVNSGFNVNIPTTTASNNGLKEQVEDTTTVEMLETTTSATSENNNAGFNSNLGLGPLGNVNSGFNVNIPTTTTTEFPATTAINNGKFSKFS